MGVLYTVWPLSADINDWLDEQNVEYPRGLNGRHPTPNEMRAALRCLTDFEGEETGPHPDGRWQLLVQSIASPEEGPWTLLNATGFQADDEPCEVGFEKGWPDLIVKLLLHAAEATGPLVLIPDTGCEPVVVWRARTLEDTLSGWPHLDP